jgi:hypothetical protein
MRKTMLKPVSIAAPRAFIEVAIPYRPQSTHFKTLQLDHYDDHWPKIGWSNVCFHVRTPCLLVFAFITLMAGKAKLYMANLGYAFAPGMVPQSASCYTRDRRDGSYLMQLKSSCSTYPIRGPRDFFIFFLLSAPN